MNDDFAYHLMEDEHEQKSVIELKEIAVQQEQTFIGLTVLFSFSAVLNE